MAAPRSVDILEMFRHIEEIEGGMRSFVRLRPGGWDEKLPTLKARVSERAPLEDCSLSVRPTERCPNISTRVGAICGLMTERRGVGGAPAKLTHQAVVTSIAPACSFIRDLARNAAVSTLASRGSITSRQQHPWSNLTQGSCS